VTIELKAPTGKFRVIGVDTFDGTDWIEKDCDTLNEARQLMMDSTKGKDMLKMHVYDDGGNHLDSAGRF